MGDETEKSSEAFLLHEATKRAAVTPLPGALSEAFIPTAIKCGDNLSVRRVVASDWKILQFLESPIIKQMLEMQKDAAIREEVPFTDEEAWEMCWQFTHDPKASRDLAAQGREAYRETAYVEMADQITLTEANNIVKAIGKQILKSFETGLRYAPKDEPQVEKKTTTPTP